MLIEKRSSRDYQAFAIIKLRKQQAEYVVAHQFSKLEAIGKGDSKAGFVAKSWYGIAYINPPTLFV
jgi:hypothetical protein